MMDLSPDNKFKVKTGAAVLSALALVGFGWKAQATLSAILIDLKETKNQIVDVAEKMNGRMNSFETVMSDRWTKAQAAEWSLRVLVANPALRIPDPRNPSLFLNDGPRAWMDAPRSDTFVGRLP